MAASGFTPIKLYYSATTTNVPLAANLAAGELAINTFDGKLFYKDSSNVVQVIGTKGGVGSSTTTQVLYNSSGLVAGSSNLTFDGNNLGIGTTSPTSRLHVEGANVTLTVKASSGFAAQVLNAATSNVSLVAFQANSVDQARIIGDTSTLQFCTGSANTERMRIDSSGNVNLNNNISLQFKNSGGTDLAMLTINGSNNFIYGPSGAFTGQHIWYRSGAEAMRIDALSNLVLLSGGAINDARAKLDIQNNSAGLQTTGLHLGYSAADFYGSRIVNVSNPSATAAGLFKIQQGTTGAWRDDFVINDSGIVTMSAYGAGAATFSAAGVISSVSDETWKIKDGAPVDPDSMLNKLEPGYWYYNEEKKETFGTDRQLGFYAQNVNSAIGPEAAPTPEEGKPWGYYDRSVLAVTVMSLQKALATIESLTARIAALEAR